MRLCLRIPADTMIRRSLAQSQDRISFDAWWTQTKCWRCGAS